MNTIPALLRIGGAKVALPIFFVIVVHTSGFSQSTRTTVQSGNWTNKNTWDCSCIPASTDNAVIATGHTVTFVSTNTVNDLTINSGGVVSDNGLTNTINGNIVINGTYSGTGPVLLSGSNKTISGTGVISNTGAFTITGNKTISAGTVLIKNAGDITISSSTTISNSGNLTIGGSIIGTNSTSVWSNDQNSTLNIGGQNGSETTPLIGKGTLYASYSGNTVNYFSSENQTIKLPSDGYYHLTASGGSQKFFETGGPFIVNGNLNITSSLNGDNRFIEVKGNWNNSGNFTEGLGTVTFNGSGNQTVTNATGETFYNLVINKTATLILSASAIVSNELTLTSGDVNTGTNKLTLGTGTSAMGSLTRTSGTIIGKFERWISSTTTGTDILFPIGTSSYYRPLSVNFSGINSGGSLIAQFVESYPGNSGLPITDASVTLHNTYRDGYWSLSKANSFSLSGGNTYTLNLTGNGFSGFSNFLTNANTRIVTRSNSSSSWSKEGSENGGTRPLISRTAMKLLDAEYAIGDDTNCSAPASYTVSGTQDLCPGSDSYTVSTTGTNYTWEVSGGSITSSQPYTSTIDVDWTTQGVGTVSVIVGNSCMEGAKVVYSVNVHSVTPSSITGKVNVPENATGEVYSITAQSGYTYNWSISGGTITNNSGNSITVSWGSAGTGSLSVTGTWGVCSQSSASALTITKYKVVSSIKTGQWNSQATWDCSCVPANTDNITVKNTHTVSLSGQGATAKHVNVNAGGVINTNTNALTITGDMTINGSISGTGNISLTGSGSIIDGTGTISNTGSLSITTGKTILSTAVLTKSAGAVNLSSDIVITNNGRITLGGDLTGGSAGTTWINAQGATLALSGELLSTGTLSASAINNTISYNGLAQSIKSGQYYNLSLSGTGNKTAPASLFVKGDFSDLSGSGASGFVHNNGTIEFNGTTTITNTYPVSFNSVQISSSSTLTSSSSSINIAGDFVNGGSFIHNSGTVQLNGSGDQIIDPAGANFYNMSINKGGGDAILSSALNLISVLTMQSNTIFQSNGNLTLVSSSDSPDVSASIATLPDAASITGNVNIQRFISNEGRFYRYISSPVSDGIISDWQDDFTVTGNFTGKSLKDPYNNSATICGTAIKPTSASLFYYNEAATGLEDVGYVAYPSTSNSAPLEVGKGYAAFIRETCYRDVTVSVSGQINKGEISLPVEYHNTGYPTGDGWNLVGNPYPSAINWDVAEYPGNSIGWTKTNIASAIAIPDNGSGMMRYFDAPYDGGDDFNGVISSGQAFWVRSTGSPTLTIREGVKVNDAGQSFYRTSKRVSIPSIKVTLSHNDLSDYAVIKERSTSIVELDNWDAPKLKNESFGISVQTPNGIPMAINAIPEIKEGLVIPIKLEDLHDGEFAIDFTSSEKWNEYSIELTDHGRGIKRIMNWNDKYLFSVSPEIFNGNRFTARIVRYQPSEIQVVKLVAYPNPVKDILTLSLPPDGRVKYIAVFDQKGVKVEDRVENPEVQNAEISFSSKPRGVYLVRLVGPGYNVLTKVIKD